MNERQVEVSHEALIRGWPKLRQWIDQDRAGQRLHRQISDAARDWQTTKDPGVLYRGVRLGQAIEWQKLNKAALNGQERRFLKASRNRKRLFIAWIASAILIVLLVLFSFARQRVEAKAQLAEIETRRIQAEKLLAAQTEALDASRQALIANVEASQAQLDLAKAQITAPGADAKKLVDEIASLKTKLAQSPVKPTKVPAQKAQDPVLIAQAAALKASEASLDEGFQLREDYWGGTLSVKEQKAVRQRLFAGNEYRFWAATNVRGSQVSIHVYDGEGKLAEVESVQNGNTSRAKVIPKRTGDFYMILEIEESEAQSTSWAIVYGFR